MKTILATNQYGKYCIPDAHKQWIDAKTIHRGEVWEPDTIEYIIEHCPHDLIHAGTSFGDFLPAFRSINVVWAFEPCEISFKCAMETISLNELNNIRLVNGALGATTKNTRLRTRKNGKALCSASEVQDNAPLNESEPIRVFAIDGSVPIDSHISMIQLDVEGHELYALQGAVETINRWSPTLILETKPQVTKPLLAFLTALKYHQVGTLHNNVNTIWERQI